MKGVFGRFFLAVSFAMFFSLSCGYQPEQSMLVKAISENNVQEVKALLSNPQVIRRELNPRQNSSLPKPIILATVKRNNEIVKLLVEAGADINVDDGKDTGDTPLILSMMTNNDELVEFLIDHGADVNKPNNFGITPFWGASVNQNIEYVKLCIANGANIDQFGRAHDPLRQYEQIIGGITPLMMASFQGNIEIIKLLIESGASKDLKDFLGRSALVYAGVAKKEPVIELLKNK
ncbi:MAG: ankyrin repeat domain-containing protein [Candidatus Omnitrophica bacterium]|nr:ankyrin repeat domain-containing protein [Candidatus Omnitrophota bacterium]